MNVQKSEHKRIMVRSYSRLNKRKSGHRGFLSGAKPRKTTIPVYPCRENIKSSTSYQNCLFPLVKYKNYHFESILLCLIVFISEKKTNRTLSTPSQRHLLNFHIFSKFPFNFPGTAPQFSRPECSGHDYF